MLGHQIALEGLLAERWKVRRSGCSFKSNAIEVKQWVLLNFQAQMEGDLKSTKFA